MAPPKHWNILVLSTLKERPSNRALSQPTTVKDYGSAERLATRIQGLVDPFISATVSAVRLEDITEVREDVDIVVADPPLLAQVLDFFPKVQWVQSTYAGINAVLASKRRDYVLTRMTGFGPSMAEYAIGHILMRERHFIRYHHDQLDRSWEPVPSGFRRMDSLIVGILGASGQIGSHLSRACKAFGMTITGYMRTPRSKTELATLGIDKQFTNLNEFLASADYIINVLPSTPQTRGLLNGTVLASCQHNPVFINVGRADVISNEALFKALDERWLSHAILDVHMPYPLPTGSKLWDREDITITPYVAAIPYSDEVAQVFLDNLNLYLDHQPMNAQVDWNNGY